METQRLNSAGAFSALQTGTVLDRYRIDSIIAAGGFGITYLCQHTGLGKLCAMKEHFPRQFAYREGATSEVRPSDPGTFSWTLDRFLQEGRALARCRHPNVVGVADVFEANGTAYMVLDYVQGQSLKSWLDEFRRPPTQAELDHILAPILDALAYIHSTGLLHRDIAPDNIIIRTDGTPCLIDFGAARQAVAERSELMSAVVKGGYSPPEQYTRSGKAQGPWSDIYALAATLYRAIAGKAPQEAPERQIDDEMRSLTEICAERARHPSEVHSPPDSKPAYRPAFLAAIDAGLRLRHSERPQSIEAWRADLMRGVQTTTLVPKPPERPPIIPGATASPPVTRGAAAPPARVMLAALLVISATAAGGWWWFTRNGAPPARSSVASVETRSEVTAPASPVAPAAQPPPTPTRDAAAPAQAASEPIAAARKPTDTATAAEERRRVDEAASATPRPETAPASPVPVAAPPPAAEPVAPATPAPPPAVAATPPSAPPAAPSPQPDATPPALPAPQVATPVAPPPVPTPDPTPVFDVADSQNALAMQRELKRVGCYPGALDGSWGAGSETAFREFLRHSKSVAASRPTAEHLQLARAAPGRICPLVCDADERAVGDRCVEIARPPPPPEPKRQPPKPANTTQPSYTPPKPSGQPNCGAFIACTSLYRPGRGDIHCQRPPGC